MSMSTMVDTFPSLRAPVAADSAWVREVAELVVSPLNLETAAADIQPDEPLYGDDLAAFCVGCSVLANLLNLPLLILVFTAAYLARLYLLARSDSAGPLEAFRAYRQASASTAPRPS